MLFNIAATFALLFLTVATPTLAPSSAPVIGASGYWSGSLIQRGKALDVVMQFKRAQSQYAGTFTADTQAVMEYPFDSVALKDSHIAFVLGGGDMRFEGEVVGEVMNGQFTGDEGTGTFTLHRVAPPVLPYAVETVHFQSHGATLAGTLCVPRGPGRHAGVVLLHGSGPQSRWGTLRFIADRLARAGIAALAYDKRGSGESTGDWRTVGYDVLAGDAIAGMNLLAAHSGVDRNRIGIWGHSQGAYIAPLIAHRSGHVAFIVAADGNDGTNEQQDLLRATNQIRDNGWTGESGAQALALYKQFLAVAAAGGQGYDALAAQMQREKQQPWVDWMAVPPRTSWLFKWYPLVASYDSRAYWKTVRVPVLLVYGEHDELSDVPGSIASITAEVKQAGGPPVKAIVLPGAPHTLHIAPAPKQPFFWSYMAHGYPDQEVQWISARFK
jgi:hypothetical protein